MNVVGPLFRHELMRLARRGLQPKLRAVFAVLLLVALLFSYLAAFPGVSPIRVLIGLDEPMSIAAASRFGERFLIAFLLVQLVVVVIITPAMAGGAICEEKERGTLDFLLMSQLSGLEIVLGKMLARVVFVVGVVLTGLPVLVLTMFFGGVDGGQLLAGYAVTLLTILSLGAFSLYLAVVSDGLREALTRAYVTVLGLTVFGFCCWCFSLPVPWSPFSTLWTIAYGWPGFLSGNTPASPGWVTASYALIHLPAAAVFLWRAAKRVRPTMLGLADPTPWVGKYRDLPRDDDLPPLQPSGVPRPVGALRNREVPELLDNEDPFVWKERWFGGWLLSRMTIPRVAVCQFAFAFLMFTLGFGADALERGRTMGSVTGPLTRFATAVTVPALVLGIGLLAAGSVARERQRQTLESLLSLPIERYDILRAKARTAVRAVWPLAVGMAVATLTGVCTGGAAVAALLVAPVVLFGWGLFALGFGMWLSVRCRTTTRATGYFLVTVLTACIAPLLVSPLVRGSMPNPNGSVAAVLEAVIDGLGPMSGGWYTLTRPDQVEWWLFMIPLPMVGAADGALFAGAMGGAFWQSAVRLFEKEGR